MNDRDRLATATTFLFVPGDRPERFDRAAGAGADAVVLDLEDAVAPGHKDPAREEVARWVAARPGGAGPALVVRINGADTPWHAADVAMAARTGCAVMLPKAADPVRLRRVVRDLGGLPVLPLVETASGVLAARRICAVRGVVRPAFGSVDLAAETGVDPADRDALRHARSMVVLAAASAGTAAPIDGVSTAVDDVRAVRDDTMEAVRLGFTAKLCIHPRQVPVVRQAMAPTPEQVRWARAVLAAASGGDAVTVVAGRMVDKPVIDRARSILDRVVAGGGDGGAAAP